MPFAIATSLVLAKLGRLFLPLSFYKKLVFAIQTWKWGKGLEAMRSTGDRETVGSNSIGGCLGLSLGETVNTS